MTAACKRIAFWPVIGDFFNQDCHFEGLGVNAENFAENFVSVLQRTSHWVVQVIHHLVVTIQLKIKRNLIKFWSILYIWVCKIYPSKYFWKLYSAMIFLLEKKRWQTCAEISVRVSPGVPSVKSMSDGNTCIGIHFQCYLYQLPRTKQIHCRILTHVECYVPHAWPVPVCCSCYCQSGSPCCFVLNSENVFKQMLINIIYKGSFKNVK